MFLAPGIGNREWSGIVLREIACLASTIPHSRFSFSIRSFLGLDVLHLVVESPGVHRAVAELHLGFAGAPGDAVFHPLVVVALGEILVGVGAARFLAVLRRSDGDQGLA